jgi:hypothetical protein
VQVREIGSPSALVAFADLPVADTYQRTTFQFA